MPEVYFKKVNDDFLGTEYGICTEYFDTSFIITVMQTASNNCSYRNKVAFNEIENFDACKEALTKDSPQYLFLIDEQSNFSIKRCVKPLTTIKITLANIKLIKISDMQVRDLLFDVTMKNSNYLCTSIENWKIKYEESEKARLSYLSRLEEVSASIQNRDKILLGRVLNLLNSKKEIICNLTGGKPEPRSISLFDCDTDIDDEQELANEPLVRDNDDLNISTNAKVIELHNEEPTCTTNSQSVSNVMSPFCSTVDNQNIPTTNEVCCTNEIRPSIENILDSLSFVDPTIPFKQ